MSDAEIKGFFAYPSTPPAVAEVIRNAAERINVRPDLKILLWQDLRAGGKIIIREICDSIEKSVLFLSDLTGVNPNVMFELGFAVARNKRAWVVLDTTRSSAKRDYDQLRLLTGIGYCSYTNSQDIVNGFFRDQPFDDLNGTL